MKEVLYMNKKIILLSLGLFCFSFSARAEVCNDLAKTVAQNIEKAISGLTNLPEAKTTLISTVTPVAGSGEIVITEIYDVNVEGNTQVYEVHVGDAGDACVFQSAKLKDGNG